MSAAVLRAGGVVVTRGPAVLLDRVGIRIAAGEVHGVIGPNGAGKSTLLRALAATERVAAGAVLVDGAPLTALGSRARARVRALLPQEAGSGDGFRVRELVAMGRYAYGNVLGGPLTAADEEAVSNAMRRAGIDDLADRAVDELSGGQRRLVFLAKALAQLPRVLLLDEPLAALDPRHQLETLRLLRALAADGLGVVAVLHDLELAARTCDRLSVVASGRVLVTGAPEDVLTPALLASVYGVRADVAPDPLTGGLRVALLDPLPDAFDKEHHP